ncbi:hypothetical protein N7494_013192 [Penicillium frequentans]|uniref:Uncharacterized protein n=1 Tax=Penicillium frequentans TaxID=3151616 RepID=A0AAD6CHS2_9EURO|nr:hypothetical protein N7494_013192 [Penicillium glabrum]
MSMATMGNRSSQNQCQFMRQATASLDAFGSCFTYTMRGSLADFISVAGTRMHERAWEEGLCSSDSNCFMFMSYCMINSKSTASDPHEDPTQMHMRSLILQYGSFAVNLKASDRQNGMGDLVMRSSICGAQLKSSVWQMKIRG